MRLHRGVLLTIVAVVGMSVIAVASASAALPEFKPVPTKKHFTMSSGTVTLDVPGYGAVVQCTKGAATGEITGAKTVGDVVFVYTGCEMTKGRENCPASTKGAKEGEIVTRASSGELGSVAKAEAFSEVGLRFKATEAKKSWYVLSNSCIEETGVTGSVAAEIGLPATKSTTHELAFDTLENGSKQEIKEIKLDSGELEKPELVFAPDGMTLSDPAKLTFEEAVEI